MPLSFHRKIHNTRVVQLERQGRLLHRLCNALVSWCKGFSCTLPSLCSLKSNAFCWEANRIKLVHKYKEALKKDVAKHFLDLHQAKHCVSVGVNQINVRA